MAKVPCRLAALDLDGTLLNDDHIVTDRNCKTLQKLSAQGIVVVLVSGRMHRSILPFSEQIGLANPIISYNGGMVKHAKTGEVFHHIPIPGAIAAELVEYCDQLGLHLNFCLNDELYIKESNQWSDLYESRTGVPATPVGDLHQLDGDEPTKIQVLDTPEKIDRLLIEFKDAFGERLYVTRTQIEYIEFMNPQVSKGLAIRALAAQLDIPMDLVVAFGDGYNDASMMEVAGFRVAMGNAVDEIKACADYVTDTNHNDGVALATEPLLLDDA
ncbi:MAG: Cof-type HAD-IIB family hydrolase [Candidatus Poribacteria bacterium]|nr:Cof-type HAD-IIB family hydrolase [Candidatus Poribacteria bacterium]